MIFLDVGAHKGETLRLLKGHTFERIVAFEPSPDCWPALEAEAFMVDAQVIRAGLLGHQGREPLFYSGSAGASIHADKRFFPDYIREGAEQPTACDFLRASAWFQRHVFDPQSALLKLNCEGSEVAILDDLVATGEIDKVASIALDWDCEKIESLRGESSRVRRSLTVPIWTEKWSITCAENPDPIAKWLAALPALL